MRIILVHLATALAFLFVTGFCNTSAFSQFEAGDKELIAKAVEKLKKVESIATFRLHGAISFDQESYEVWLEGRGDRFWFKRDRKAKDKREAEAFEKRIAIVESDLAELYVFDGKRMHIHTPSRLRLVVEEKEGFKAPTGFASMLPQSWLQFGLTPQKPKTNFRTFLTDLLPECKVVKDKNQNGIRIMRQQDPAENGKPVGHASRHLVIERASSFITATDASGGIGLSVVNELTWEETPSEMFLAKCKSIVGGQRVTEWSIDEFTADPSNVRNDFSIDPKTLPLGTKIDIEPYDKKHANEVNFVGGPEGERVYKNKTEAIRKLVELAPEPKKAN
jgi:hypothetical protein